MHSAWINKLNIFTRLLTKEKKLLFISSVGNILEFYDFTLYAAFAIEISRTFVLENDPTAKLVITLGIYATGFLMRPIGGIVFGHIGDKYGRKTALTLTLLGMGFATSLIGLLPSAQTIGIAAPLLLTSLRMLQGFCLGGEGAGAAIFCLEHFQGIRPNLVSSLLAASNIFGALLAILTGIFIKYFFDVTEVMWRMAFLLGGVVGLIGLYFRLKTYDTPIYIACIKKQIVSQYPIKQILSKYKTESIMMTFLGGINIAFSCTLLLYVQTFLINTMHVNEKSAIVYMAFGAFCHIMLLPIFGLLADQFGHHRVLYYAIIAICLFSIPIFYFIGFSKITMLSSILMLSALAAAIYAPTYHFMVDLLPPQYRYSGIAFNFNLGGALFGGTAPIIASYFIQKGYLIMPGVYFMALSLSFMVVWYFYKRSKQNNDPEFFSLVSVS